LRVDLRDLQRDIGATTILVTHDPEEAFQLADEVLLLDAGQVLQSGAINAVWARPASALAARLLGADNIATGIAAAPNLIDIGHGLHLEVAGPPLPMGAQLGWAVGPGCIRIGQGGRYPAAVEALEPVIAGQRQAMLRIGCCSLRAALPGGAAMEPGECQVSIDPSAVQVWRAQGI
jgi:molybdate transport system permease protein